MTSRREIPVLFAAIAVLAIGVAAGNAQQTRMKYDKDGRVNYGAGGPNRVVQQGRTPASTSPRAPGSMPAPKCCPATASSRTTLSRRRSAIPSFARENMNRPIDRQPLNPPSDMGGYPQRFPLY